MSSSGIRFLVVDDDAAVRKLVIEFLISFGHDDVREASTGVEALDILKAERIDFVISDWEMPGISGLDLLRVMRTDDRLKTIPFIMVTSPVSKEKLKVEQAAAAEVDAYVIKPFRSKILKEKINGLLTHVMAEKSFSSRGAVLLVDDDDAVRATMREYLAEMGYSPIYEAADGDQAFDMLKEKAGEIGFVLSDWEMPKRTGIELLQKVRADAELGQTPFIMVTSQASIERIKLRQAIEADVDHYLLKPVRMKDLQDKIAQVLERAKIDVEIAAELERGEAALGKSQYREAEQAFRRVLKLSSTNAAGYYGMARLQLARSPDKGLEAAVQYLRKGAEANPFAEDCHLMLAKVFEDTRSLEKAVQALEEGVKHCTFSERIHFQLGRLLLMRAKKEDAMRHLNRAIELRPGFAEAQQLIDDVKTRGKSKRSG